MTIIHEVFTVFADDAFDWEIVRAFFEGGGNIAFIGFLEEDGDDNIATEDPEVWIVFNPEMRAEVQQYLDRCETVDSIPRNIEPFNDWEHVIFRYTDNVEDIARSFVPATN